MAPDFGPLASYRLESSPKRARTISRPQRERKHLLRVSGFSGLKMLGHGQYLSWYLMIGFLLNKLGDGKKVRALYICLIKKGQI